MPSGKPIFHILPAYVNEVRRVADAHGLAYETGEASGQPAATEFRFRSMGDAALFALLKDIPDEAYASRAIVGDPWAN